MFGSLNNLSLEELIKKIEVPNFEIEKYIVDFIYNIKINKNNPQSPIPNPQSPFFS